MYSVNLEKVLSNSAMCKQVNDVEFDSDIRNLQNVLAKNYRDLSSFDRWASEVTSKNLRWGVVHSEKFWRENARFAEAKDFAVLKALIEILKTSTDATTRSIALYDLGEFTRFYPNGRVIASALGAKEIAMKLATDESTEAEVQMIALQCVSKIMVTNWESMK
jgi:V-type H+-transporting ATPase subunit H